MGSTFEVTAGQERTEVRPGQRAELSFDLKNPGAGDRRVNILVLVEPPTNDHWFTLEGGAERLLSANGTVKLTVAVLVPEGATPGTYTLRLKVVSQADPDGEYTLGQATAIVVQSSDAPPPPPPDPWIRRRWWVVALIALAVAAAVLIAVLIPRRAGFGEACSDRKRCAEKLACVAEGGASSCRGAATWPCSSNAECAPDLRCDSTSGLCARPSVGRPCTQPSDCDSGQSCSSSGSCCLTACTAGVVSCAAGKLTRCAADGCTKTEEACACGCSTAGDGCTAALCQAGARRCAGAGVEQCAASGCAWEPLTPCTNGHVCDPGSGSCVCPAGLAECSGACVRLSDDPAHCGACGQRCLGNDPCAASLCRGTVTLSGTSQVFPLNHTGGDREFNSHGPNVTACVSASPSQGALRLSLTVEMVETVSDFTRGSGSSVVTVPFTDRTVVAVRSPNFCATYRDTDHGLDDVRSRASRWDNSPLVSAVSCVGDTDGDDICSDRSWASRDCSGCQFNLGSAEIDYRPR